MRHKLMLKRAAAGSLSVLLSLSLCMTALAAENSSSDQEEPEKSQTVYVTTDENGNTKEVIVSNHLANREQSGTLTDYSDLENITNVKGDETFDENNGKIVWNADGNDIYYQGTTDKELPVSVKYTYYLDGKEMSASEIAGKSGEVKIRIDYTNNAMTTVKVDGNEQKVVTPFVMMTGMILSNDSFKNVSVTNGKVVSDGNRSIVIGYGLPGLKDTLKLQQYEQLKDVDVPDFVEITASTDCFELDNSLTFASTGLFSELGLDESEDFEDLKDKLEKLTDAVSQLLDGSKALSDGADELSDGTGALVDGVDRVSDGADKLSDGVDQVADGISQLYDKKDALIDGIGQIDTGAASAQLGAQQVQAGVVNYTDGASQISAAVEQLNSTVQALGPSLAAGLTSLSGGAAKLSTGAGLVKDGITTINEQAEPLVTGLETMQTQVDGLNTTLQNVKSAVTQICIDAQTIGQSAATLSSSVNTAANTQMKAKVAEAMAANGYTEDQIDAVLASLGSIDVTTDSSVAGSFSSINTALNDMGTHVSALSATSVPDLTELSNGVSDLKTGLSSLVDQTSDTSDLVTGCSSLENGVTDLDLKLAAMTDPKTGSLTLLSANVQKLADATTGLVSNNEALNNGMSDLVNGLGTLKTGTKTLNASSGDLDNGITQLYTGSAALVSGASDLASGTVELADGAKKVDEGAKQLSEGAKKLYEGVREFDEEGVSKISDAVDDFKPLLDTLKALKEADSQYGAFDGYNAKDPILTNTKFVVETTGITVKDEVKTDAE